MLISNIIIKMKNLSLRILGMLVYGFSLKMTRWSVLFLLPKSLYYIYHLKHLYSASKNVTMFWTTQLEETIFVKTKQNKTNQMKLIKNVKLGKDIVRCAVHFLSCFWLFSSSYFLQVVDHAGSVEEGAALIFSHLERIIKQVHTYVQELTSGCCG